MRRRAPSAERCAHPRPIPGNRAFRMVDEATFREFHKRWRDIDRTYWPLYDGTGANWDVIDGLRDAARRELRAEVAATTQMFGRYLVPV